MAESPGRNPFFLSLAVEDDENFNPRPALNVWDSYLFGVGDTQWILNFNALFQRWESHGGQHPAMVWNDPSVMRVGNEFWMWLSGGFSRDGVRIFRFTSADGVDWTVANGGSLSGWHVLLYFTDVKCRNADCTGYPVPIRGISLAVTGVGLATLAPQ